MSTSCFTRIAAVCKALGATSSVVFTPTAVAVIADTATVTFPLDTDMTITVHGEALMSALPAFGRDSIGCEVQTHPWIDGVSFLRLSSDTVTVVAVAGRPVDGLAPPQVDGVTVDARWFVEALHSVSVAAGGDDLAAVRVAKVNGSFTVGATDRRRVNLMSSGENRDAVDALAPVWVPSTAVAAALAAMSTVGTVTVRSDGEVVSFENESATIVAPVVSSALPPLESLLPSKPDQHSSARLDALWLAASAARVASFVAGEPEPAVSLCADPDTHVVALSVQHRDVSMTATLHSEVSGTALAVTVPLSWLLETAVGKHGVLNLTWSDPLSPIMLATPNLRFRSVLATVPSTNEQR